MNENRPLPPILGETAEAAAIAGGRAGAAAEGRERPLAAFLAEQRAKHGFPGEWPKISDGDVR